MPKTSQPTEASYLPADARLFDKNEQGNNLRYIDAMPRLIADGRTPWNPADIMDARNAAVGTEREAQFWRTYWNTDFGIAGTKKEIVLFPNSKRLRAVTAETVLENRGIPLTKKQLNEGERYERTELADYLNRSLTQEEFGSSPTRKLWLRFAENDEKRLNTYADNAFTLGKRDFKYDEVLGLFVCDDGIERGLVFNGTYYRADAGGNDGLDYDARLVGVRRVVVENAPEGRAPLQKPAPAPIDVDEHKAVLPYTPTDVEAARQEFVQLQAIVKDEKVKSLEALLRKL